MFGFLKKKKDGGVNENGEKIRVIREAGPNECGGTSSYVVENAPTEIESTEMTLFSVTSALPIPAAGPDSPKRDIRYVSAFAAPAQGGSFLFLETGDFPCRSPKVRSFALVREDVFPELTEFVREHKLAEKNGHHSETHGLPENFGGAVRICYASGEKISFSNNQHPIVSLKTGLAAAKLFESRMANAVALPEPEEIASIRFSEEREKGAFCRATLTFGEDGAINEKTSKYEGPEIYESKKEVPRESVDNIFRAVAEGGIFAWPGLPEREYGSGSKKTLTFTLKDGREITVDDARDLPRQISGAFFAIELEMTTKN